MDLEKGDRVTFTQDVGGFWGRRVAKGTEATVTRAGGWGSDPEVTLEDGPKLTVSKDKLSKIGGGKRNWW
jgi:hypothetical protein